MKSKELEQSIENLSNEYTNQTLPSFSENGEDYKKTIESHKNFIRQMKESFYKLLKEYNITVQPDGDFDKLCSYTEKLLLSDDEKQIIKNQKLLLSKCARHALDVTSNSRDENNSDEIDAKNRKLKPSQAFLDFKSEARNQIYSQASSFEFLASDFYTENINNLTHFLSTRSIPEKTLENIHFDITQKCKLLTKSDVQTYQDMILKDSNESFDTLEEIQKSLFSQMDNLVKDYEHQNDPFGTLTPEERKEHEEKVKQAIAESKEKSQDEKVQTSDNEWTLPDSIL